MPKILIVDDHFVVRKGLVAILTEAPDAVVVEEAESGSEALGLVSRKKYDLVLLDIAMPDKNGLEVLKEIKDDHPQLPVLMLSMHPEEQYAVQSLRAGASGYLMKGSAPEELMVAVRKVLAGGRHIGAELAEKIAYGVIGKTGKELHESLSTREYQVMLMIAAGKTTRRIADEMLLSVKTVNTFRSRLMHKMKLKGNVELTHYVLQHHLME
jgi:two-component system, NarL family, invasion response regulator UvrY